ncbi:hypothetical protein WN51_07448 [Melipona quadrifasciata]|uniref:Uncharacterized protein n=1 Tax=Melipona quadrifasciata TaxID=166423 RepID=A0A0M9A746_9HYME|nr:hypothetical protein WN51_07448 [Melipona quadrifasciata]
MCSLELRTQYLILSEYAFPVSNKIKVAGLSNAPYRIKCLDGFVLLRSRCLDGWKAPQLLEAATLVFCRMAMGTIYMMEVWKLWKDEWKDFRLGVGVNTDLTPCRIDIASQESDQDLRETSQIKHSWDTYRVMTSFGLLFHYHGGFHPAAGLYLHKYIKRSIGDCKLVKLIVNSKH